ncbi:glycoside hydrolase family 61 /Carbohydrate-binding module family 1 [Cryphonectria parasitica EP155]|uniref:lytic cellulose monooxygenase (C4-dehydrogenating) n=1 Tax=Cryphonectria parasitica (strain ATCC 38755 / EP155) TaxID=660469 RepID=A0A9P4YCU3_CRYP1|nr:glycoside hydrolase family 61 /Carbohydrate-binding module family 1 [Cryphonectria parasitica EP155]KAF3771142.1 glycoside hydrolase family 61 /Carbohydrate-binding module family 1 [Cryphonectria parasitica EP155]
MSILSRSILGALAATTTVLAHSHVNNLVIDGVWWQGYDPTVDPYLADPPIVVGWTADDTDNGFVAPDAYQTGDIICHKNATPAGGHATVVAGQSISIQWAIPWPDSHKGPYLDYLAACNGDCETVDKTTLEFFKIDQVGYINGSDPGIWGDDVFINNNSTWLVQIPEDLLPGNYVLRTEIIALHSAETEDGAQNYPQCFNLAVSGTGTLLPSGTYGTDLYHETDPGILYNIYVTSENYTIPGPTLYSGFPSSVEQTSSTATVTSSAITPGAASTSASSVASTTSTTLVTTTTAPAVTTSATSAATGGQSLYGQCGGSGWTGPTICASGTCTTENAYYAQCL